MRTRLAVVGTVVLGAVVGTAALLGRVASRINSLFCALLPCATADRETMVLCFTHAMREILIVSDAQRYS